MMMAEDVISLLVALLVVARAVNILKIASPGSRAAGRPHRRINACSRSRPGGPAPGPG
jgi:hypothetical protein